MSPRKAGSPVEFPHQRPPFENPTQKGSEAVDSSTNQMAKLSQSAALLVVDVQQAFVDPRWGRRKLGTNAPALHTIGYGVVASYFGNPTHVSGTYTDVVNRAMGGASGEMREAAQ